MGRNKNRNADEKAELLIYEGNCDYNTSLM